MPEPAYGLFKSNSYCFFGAVAAAGGLKGFPSIVIFSLIVALLFMSHVAPLFTNVLLDVPSVAILCHFLSGLCSEVDVMS